MLRVIAPAGITGLAATLLGASEPLSPFFTLAAAFLGSGLVAALATAHARRRSGEDRGDAAESVGTGAAEVAQGATSLVAPLNARNLELTHTIAGLESKLATARRQEAERAIALADQQAEMLRMQRDAESQHSLDRAEIHELRGQLAEAIVDLTNARTEIETLKVRLGESGERRSGDRRDP